MARPRKQITQFRICETCGVTFPKPVKFSMAQWAITRFCNKKCSGQWLSKIKTGVSASWNKGKRMSEESKLKNRLAHLKQDPLYKRGGYYTMKAMERYARLKGAKGKFTLEQWEELKHKHDFRCVHCGKSQEEVKLTKDHIVPLTKGGSNYIENIQPLCQSCNSRKGNRFLPQNA